MKCLHRFRNASVLCSHLCSQVLTALLKSHRIYILTLIFHVICVSGCDGVEDDFLHMENIGQFDNCTRIKGSIKILIPTLNGYVF